MQEYKNIIRKNIKSILTENKDKKSEKTLTEALEIVSRQSTNIPVVYIGTSTCGVIAGADKTLKAIQEYKSDYNKEIEIVETGCNGLCFAEPIIQVQLPGRCRLSFKNVRTDDVNSILDGVFNGFPPTEKVLGQGSDEKMSEWRDVPYLDELSIFQSQKRHILNRAGYISPNSIEEYIANGGYKSFTAAITKKTPTEVCDTIYQSKLKGRSGSGYLTGEKWKKGLSQKTSAKYFICNADESDPGSFVDRTIAESDPHLIIEGIAIGSYAVQASHAIIYIRNRYEKAIKALAKAIESCSNLGLLGDNILDSGYNLNISINKSPGAYVCGEETALISSLEGKRGMPSPRPPYPSEKGLFGQPTIVNNVETLSNIRPILEFGPDEYKKTGTEKSSGTKLFSVSGKISRPGVIEVPMGTSFREIISTCGGIPNNNELKAIHIGGPSGGFISVKELDTRIEYDELIEAGAWMGAGSFLVLDEENCIINTTKFFIDFVKKESCGKCIPCREGSQRIHEILDKIVQKPVNNSKHESLQRFKGVMQLEELAEIMKDTSLCGLGQHAADTVLSSLKKYRSEYESHIFDRQCDAGVCKGLKTYKIDVEKCTGCTLCAQKCPDDAIIGNIRQAHFIVEDKCTGCSICYQQCKFNAIIIS